MERASSAHLALFLIFLVVAAFTGILIYLGRLKRPTVLDVCRFLKPIDAQMILNMDRTLGSHWHPTRWHYGEFKEFLLETRRCFATLQFDLRLIIAWTSSQLHMETVEKPWEKHWVENPPTEAQRLIELQEVERFTAGNRALLAEACVLQKYVFWSQLRVYLWLIFRSHWFLPFPMPDVTDLTFKQGRGPFLARKGSQLLCLLYLKMAQAAVDLGELYDATGGVSGVRGCFEEVFMNFKQPEPVTESM